MQVWRCKGGALRHLRQAGDTLSEVGLKSGDTLKLQQSDDKGLHMGPIDHNYQSYHREWKPTKPPPK